MELHSPEYFVHHAGIGVLGYAYWTIVKETLDSHLPPAIGNNVEFPQCRRILRIAADA